MKAAGRETWYDAAGAVQELYFTPDQGQGAFTRSRCTWCWTIDCYVRHRGEGRQGLLRDGPGRTAVHGPGCAGAQDACVINDLGYGGGGWHCSSPLHARASSRKAPGRAGRRMSTSRLSLIIECIPRLQRCLAPGASRSAIDTTSFVARRTHLGPRRSREGRTANSGVRVMRLRKASGTSVSYCNSRSLF